MQQSHRSDQQKYLHEAEYNSLVIDFCYNLTNRCTKKSDKPGTCRYFGVPRIPNHVRVQENNVAYHRMVKDLCLYQTNKKQMSEQIIRLLKLKKAISFNCLSL